MITIVDIFFELPLKFRPLVLDSQYHPRMPDDLPTTAPRQLRKPGELPTDWQIGDPI